MSSGAARTVRRAGAAALAAPLVLGLVACGSDSAKTSAPSVVSVLLSEYSVAVSPAKAGGGDVTLQIDNKGTITHELVVLRTDLDPTKLPTDAAGDVDEEGAGVQLVDEREDIRADSTTTLELHLAKGSYVLVCNLTGHYASGMRAALTVERDATGSASSSSSGAADDPESRIVPDFDVAQGLNGVKDQLASLAADLGPDPAKAMLGIYESWYTFEGTVRAKDQSTYLDLEDALAAAKRAADAKDEAKMAEAASTFATLAATYLAAHPA